MLLAGISFLFFMEIIPCISLKKGTIWAEEEKHTLTIEELKTLIEADKKLYVVDYDGIDENEPNIELLQELSEEYILWVDTGPRNIEDLVDAVITGASMVTLDDTIWPNIDVPAVKDVVEDEVYIALDFTKTSLKDLNPSVFFGIEGIIILNSREEIEADFTTGSLIKDLAKTHKIYAFETLPENKPFWEEKGIIGLLVDLDYYKEF